MKNERKKFIRRELFSLLAGVLLLAALPTDAEAKIYRDTLRLHILANSDTEEDQAQKLRLRDAILSRYGVELSGCDTLADAEALTERKIEELRLFSEDFLRSEGCSYPVFVTLTTEWYETRAYESFTLPAGYYRSLRVIIGEGEGHNWWCVMYPPLCLDMAIDTNAPSEPLSRYSPEEVRLIDGKKTRIRFKTLEILSEVFRQKG